MDTDSPVLHVFPALREQRQRELEAAIQLWDEASDWPFPLRCAFMDGRLWLYETGVGAISFGDHAPAIDCYPASQWEQGDFLALVNRSWLPYVYAHWGWQVLHAAAVYHRATRCLIAFTGMTHAGKSTLAYALGQRAGWQQFADDTLRFSHENGRITFLPLVNVIQLRAASAEYFGHPSDQQASIDWPDDSPELTAIYALAEPDTDHSEPTITPLNVGESYAILLQQAFCITRDIPTNNRRLALDYLSLLKQVPVYRLIYPKFFDQLDATLDLIEQHFQAQLPETKVQTS